MIHNTPLVTDISSGSVPITLQRQTYSTFESETFLNIPTSNCISIFGVYGVSKSCACYYYASRPAAPFFSSGSGVGFTAPVATVPMATERYIVTTARHVRCAVEYIIAFAVNSSYCLASIVIPAGNGMITTIGSDEFSAYTPDVFLHQQSIGASIGIMGCTTPLYVYCVGAFPHKAVVKPTVTLLYAPVIAVDMATTPPGVPLLFTMYTQACRRLDTYLTCTKQFTDSRVTTASNYFSWGYGTTPWTCAPEAGEMCGGLASSSQDTGVPPQSFYLDGCAGYFTITPHRQKLTYGFCTKPGAMVYSGTSSTSGYFTCSNVTVKPFIRGDLY